MLPRQVPSNRRSWPHVTVTCACALLALGASAQNSVSQSPSAPGTVQQNPNLLGEVRGVAVGEDLPVEGATVTLKAGSASLVTYTDEAGGFFFGSVPAGSFEVKIESSGLRDEVRSGTLRTGETLELAPMQMRIAPVAISVEVLPQDKIAKLQVQEEEKQRLIGVIPNFYVVYDREAAPLPARMKYHLAWKSIIDPVNVGIVAANAGFEQSQGEFSGFGSGTAGYGKRFGAGMADLTIGSFLTSAIMPQILKQDPRYFYKGAGSFWSRAGYAATRPFVCKGDDRHWHACYSNIIGSFGSAGISNAYYPASNRHGAALTFEIGAIGFGYAAVGDLMQEFVLRQLTSKKHRQGANLPD